MRRRRGHTLMEVFLSLLLVATVFFALASVFPTSLGAMRRSAATTTASGLARQYMETWRHQDFSVLKGTLVPKDATDSLDGITYLTTITVSLPGTDLNVRQIDVKVTWSGGSYTGIDSVTYTTLVYNVENPL